MSDSNAIDDEVIAAPPARRGALKGGMLIAAGIIAGIAAGLYGVGPAFSKTANPTDAKAEAAAHTKSEHGEGTEARGPYMLENLVLNPAGTKGTRFLLFTVGIQMADEVADEAIKTRDAETRDRVIRVLGAKTLDELVDVTRREGFRLEIAAALDSVFGAKKVKSVFFPQFVVQ